MWVEEVDNQRGRGDMKMMKKNRGKQQMLEQLKRDSFPAVLSSVTEILSSPSTSSTGMSSPRKRGGEDPKSRRRS